MAIPSPSRAPRRSGANLCPCAPVTWTRAISLAASVALDARLSDLPVRRLHDHVLAGFDDVVLVMNRPCASTKNPLPVEILSSGADCATGGGPTGLGDGVKRPSVSGGITRRIRPAHRYGVRRFSDASMALPPR